MPSCGKREIGRRGRTPRGAGAGRPGPPASRRGDGRRSTEALAPAEADPGSHDRHRRGRGVSFLLYFRATQKATDRLYETTASRLIAQAREMLTKGVDKDALQKLLAGKQLSGIPAADVYPMAARSADTRKIMENPLR